MDRRLYRTEMFETVIAFQAAYDENLRNGMYFSRQIMGHIRRMGIRPRYSYCYMPDTRTTGKSIRGVKMIEASTEKRNGFMEYRPPSQRVAS